MLAPQDEVDGIQMDRMLGLGSLDKIQGSHFIKERKPVTKVEIDTEDDEESILIRDIMDINEAHRICEQIIIKKAVEKYGNITKAAEAVGINPSTIYRKIKSGQLEI